MNAELIFHRSRSRVTTRLTQNYEPAKIGICRGFSLKRPSILAFALVSVSSHWNEFLWPFIITRSAEIRPLTVGLNKLIKTTDQGAFYGQLMAGTLSVIGPLVILFLLFQRQFLESFAPPQHTLI